MKKRLALIAIIFIVPFILSACDYRHSLSLFSDFKEKDILHNSFTDKKDPSEKQSDKKKQTDDKESSDKKDKSNSDEIDMTMEEMYKLLEENGYGEGVDWSKQTDDDPSIPKSMDITSSKEKIREAYYKRFTDKYEPGDMYEKAWWDWIPASYDISGDIFPKTNNYAGQEKEYNNSLQQNIVDDGYTSGQINDLSNVERIAKTFIYEDMKNKYKWTDNLDELCKVADSFGIADFYSKESDRPMLKNSGTLSPGFMTAHYDLSIVDYDLIGLPQFGGYSFTITVWEKCDEPVGWVNELEGNAFLNEKEVYENMGEWDFYDELDATSSPSKVVKPKLPNGAMIIKGKTDNLCREMYVYKKIVGGSGNIYYYGNGITVDMTFYGGEQGGNFEDALKYCQIICHNNTSK